MRAFVRQMRPAAAALVVFTVATGVLYPLLVTGVSQLAFRDEANGSLIVRDGITIGSELIGQSFTSPGYFHSRPSAAGDGYDPTASSGSNLGPTNSDLLAAIDERVAAYRDVNGVDGSTPVPVDAVTASASGLDPMISVANARLQARRIADERDIALDDVLSIIDAATIDRPLGVLGDPGVHVLDANVALDELVSARG
jgi:potassium-transporting ATPase KdpC subunit